MPPSPVHAAAVPHSAMAYFALINTAIALFLLGAVLTISSNLEHLPPVLFMGLFTGLALAMLLWTQRALQRGAMGWARTWAWWGSVFLCIALLAAAVHQGWLGFVPDLMLVCLLVFAATAVALRHAAALLVAQLLLTLWLVLSFLYGHSYLWGLAIGLLLSWHLLLRQPQGGLLLWQSANALLLAGLYLYDAMAPQHYPLQWSGGLLLPLLALLSLLWCLARVAARGRPGRADLRLLARSLTVLGQAMLLLCALHPLWQMLHQHWQDTPQLPNPLAAALAGAAWLLALLRVWRGGAAARDGLGLGMWVLAACLLEGARLWPHGPAAAPLSVLAAAMLLATGWWQMHQGVARHALANLAGGCCWLVLGGAAAIFTQGLDYRMQTLLLWALALATAWPLWRLRHGYGRALPHLPFSESRRIVQ